MRPIDADALFLPDEKSDKVYIAGRTAGKTVVVATELLKKKVADAPTLDVVPVDDMLGEMLNWAVRYALGRMTYAVSDTVSYVMPLIPKLDRKTLSVMMEDIKSAPRYGHEIDKTDWMRLLDAIREELKRRAENAGSGTV